MIGKILMDRSISREIVRRTMRKIWRLSKKASFTKAKKNTFIVSFRTKVDKDRVITCKPRLFDSYSFALKEVKGCSQIAKTQFTT